MFTFKIRNIIFVLLVLTATTSCSHMDYRSRTVGAFKDTGAGKSFVLLNKSNLHSGKLRLDQLGIRIHFYSGYAAVKEEYTIINTSPNEISVQMGVPATGYFHNDVIDTVQFRNWSHPEIRINGATARVKSRILNHRVSVAGLHVTGNQWETWNYTFPPDTSKMDLRYLVDTHGAHIRDGMDIEYTNGFSYLLSSLRQWNSHIRKIRILFKVDSTSVRMKWMDGILPARRFKLKNRIFIYDLNDVNADSLPNIVFRYGKPGMYAPKDGFNFASVASDTIDIYRQISKSEIWNVDTTGFKTFTRDEFKPAPMGFFSVSGIIIVFSLLALGIVLLIGWGAYTQYKNS